MKKHTAEDFENARFAEHEDGRMAVRNGLHPVLPWECSDTYHNDGYMSANGWTPVPAKLTVTESEFRDAMNSRLSLWAVLTERFGINIVPDPEPTNAEKIIDLMGKAPANLNRRDLAAWLDKAGVTAPGGDS